MHNEDYIKNEVLKILGSTKNNRAFQIEELANLLNINNVEGYQQLNKTLNRLIRDGQIIFTKKSKYMLNDSVDFKEGKITITKGGYGFVELNENKTLNDRTDDVFVMVNNLNGAINGDDVLIEVFKKNSPKGPEGKVIRVIKRNINNPVGEYYIENGFGKLKLDDPKLNIDVLINLEDSKGAVDGHKVVVELGERAGDKRTYSAKVIKILGHKNEPGMDIISIAESYDIPTTFSEFAKLEAENLPMDISKEDISNRTDLRKLKTFTIDGEDTKDIDDALSIVELPNGNMLLYVHIADVSHYVKENSNIDMEAYYKGTSSYLADTVIPMLLQQLSNGICSLNERVDRLAVTVKIEYDKHGNVVEDDLFLSVIKSDKKMTYTNVNKLLDEGIITEGYEDFVNELTLLKKLSDLIGKIKDKEGYLDFNTSESKLIVDENKKVIDIQRRISGTTEKIIENSMVAANEAVATKISHMELPFLYRIHGKPDDEKIKKYFDLLNVLGYTSIELKNSKITPQNLQLILKDLKDKPEADVLSKELLKSMKKAVYDEHNIGHFGLGSEFYTHFTAPIRRYPDLIVHRLLKTYLVECKYDTQTCSYYETNLPIWATHLSERERNAVECEREVEGVKKAEYMSEKIGEDFNGVISGIQEYGMYVQLDNLTEGLVAMDNLDETGKNFIADKESFCIRNLRLKNSFFRLGDRVLVKVIGVNVPRGEIDFKLINNYSDEERRSKTR